ncbi:MAG TPA: proteasome subunit alpha [Armatimonadota bacterium]|jgi:proteasome beta subunit
MRNQIEERQQQPFDGAGRAGDFLAVLERTGHPIARPGAISGPGDVTEIHGTTVIAVKYKDGVLNVGDRRATGGTAILYDRAEKIVPLDTHTLIAISGSYATATNIIRYLQHSFKYFARTQLQEMSLDGKLSELGRMIAQNLPNAMQGIGAFLPVLSAWDATNDEGRIYFYDGMGARFETREFGAAGSGSGPIRGAFDYIVRTKGPFHEMSREQALKECLTLLDIAADLDSATGGYSKILPIAKVVERAGVVAISDEEITAALGGISEAQTGA